MSFRGRGLVARALALALVSAVALTSAFALAGSDEATIEATEFTPLDEAQGGEEFAKCGPGERALGGGVVQSGSADSLRVQASGPLDASGITLNTNDGDKAKQWYASVINIFGGADRIFRVFAICATDSNATIEATKLIVDAGQGGEEFAKCGPGERALGGGVVQSGSADSLRVQASGPLDASGLATQTKDGDKAKQWYASVASGVDDQVFRVFAICATDSNATIEATKLIVDSGLRGEEFAKCGPGERALGGGVLQQSGSAESFGVQASGPLDASGITLNTNDGDKAKQWYASVSQASGIDDRVIKVFAICA